MDEHENVCQKELTPIGTARQSRNQVREELTTKCFMSLRSPSEDKNGVYGHGCHAERAAKHLIFLTVTKARFFAYGSE
jgi:hypothetical protein